MVTWLLILAIIGFLGFAGWVMVTSFHHPPPPQTVKQIQSWTITDPDGRIWKAVKNE